MGQTGEGERRRLRATLSPSFSLSLSLSLSFSRSDSFFSPDEQGDDLVDFSFAFPHCESAARLAAHNANYAIFRGLAVRDSEGGGRMLDFSGPRVSAEPLFEPTPRDSGGPPNGDAFS